MDSGRWGGSDYSNLGIIVGWIHALQDTSLGCCSMRACGRRCRGVHRLGDELRDRGRGHDCDSAVSWFGGLGGSRSEGEGGRIYDAREE